LQFAAQGPPASSSSSDKGRWQGREGQILRGLTGEWRATSGMQQ